MGHDPEPVGIAERVEQVAGGGQLVIRSADQRAHRIERRPGLEGQSMTADVARLEQDLAGRRPVAGDVANDDEGYFDALVRMFEQTLKFANALSVDRRDDLVSRLDRVRTISHKIGYGVGHDLDFLLSKYTRHAADAP